MPALVALIVATLVHPAAQATAFLPFVGRSIIRTRPQWLVLPIAIACALLFLTLDGNVAFSVMLYVVAILLMAMLSDGLIAAIAHEDRAAQLRLV